MNRFNLAARRLLCDQQGVSAIEFALIAPILLGVLAATIDFGTLIYSRMQLENALSSAATYALASGQTLDVNAAASLANNIERILVSRLGSETVASIDVNNGGKLVYDGTTMKKSGTATQAGLCYCPTLSASTLSWGNARTCNVACGNGMASGKFVSLDVSIPLSPIFFAYGLVENGRASVHTLVKIE